jgi:hypothetical protein
MIRQRVKAGLKRAVAQGVKLGRPKIAQAQTRAGTGAQTPHPLFGDQKSVKAPPGNAAHFFIPVAMR